MRSLVKRPEHMLEYYFIKRNEFEVFRHNDNNVINAMNNDAPFAPPLEFRRVKEIRIIADEERKKKSSFLRFVQRMKRRKRNGLSNKLPKNGKFSSESSSGDEEEKKKKTTKTKKDENEETSERQKAIEKYKILYKVTETSTGTIVCSVLEQHGFTKIQKMLWNILWCGKHLKVFYLSKMNMFQRVNHFPKTSEFTRKNYLYKNYLRMRNKYGAEIFDYLPLTFSLPLEYPEFVKYLKNEEKKKKNEVFIMKPSMLSRGRGIYLVKDLKDLDYEYHPPDENGKFEYFRKKKKKQIGEEEGEEEGEEDGEDSNPFHGIPPKSDDVDVEEEEEEELIPINDKYIASVYIDNPYLIEGIKFDLRIYVAVTSFHPLRLYVYNDGLTRFASEKYKKGNYSNAYIHLTNYSINKKNKKFVYNTSAQNDNVGNKWSLRALREYLIKQESKKKIDFVFEEIYNVIIKSFLSIETSVMVQLRNFVPYRKNCFELFGFDILLDSNLKPWLLEVNLSPSLGCRFPLDFKIKSGLLVDLFNMIEIHPHNRDRKSIYKSSYKKIRPHLRDSSIMIKNVEKKEIFETFKFKKEEIEKLYFDCSLIDALVIKETIDEDNKKGDFIRIFPTEKNCDKFDLFFEEGLRPYNVLLQKKIFGKKIKMSKIDDMKQKLHEITENEIRERHQRKVKERREKEMSIRD